MDAPVRLLAVLATVEGLLAPRTLLQLVFGVQLDGEVEGRGLVDRVGPAADQADIVGMVGHRQGHLLD